MSLLCIHLHNPSLHLLSDWNIRNYKCTRINLHQFPLRHWFKENHWALNSRFMSAYSWSACRPPGPMSHKNCTSRAGVEMTKVDKGTKRLLDLQVSSSYCCQVWINLRKQTHGSLCSNQVWQATESWKQNHSWTKSVFEWSYPMLVLYFGAHFSKQTISIVKIRITWK